MKPRKLTALLLILAFVTFTLIGCGGDEDVEADKDTSVETSDTAGTDTDDEEDVASGEVKEFTAFFAVPGDEINQENDVREIIAEKIGAKVEETWLTGQTAEEAVGVIIAGGEYPDFIDGGDGMAQLYDAGALVALDDYIDDYPNIKNFFSEYEWDTLRQDDGKIYWINAFGNIHGEERATTHNDEAFWVQTRVLEWADYPEIRTLDQYFELLETYNAENPTLVVDGEELDNIPFSMLCEDWRYFVLENPALFLDGYPNDGSVAVDPDGPTVIDYNSTPTAKEYYGILNREWGKGNIIDLESFTQTYDEYIAKLSTGRVLGMCDQWWNFAYSVNDSLTQQGLEEQGCNYIPLPITISEDIENQWHTSGGTLNVASGIGITTSCEDVEGAMQFINDLLDQEIHDLRMWGVEGEDYLVDEDGIYYRTEEQRFQSSDEAYKASHFCNYSYFPQWSGTSVDEINAMSPSEQPGEFYDGLPIDVKNCFDAYGIETYVEMIGTNEAPGPWYPMYSHSNNMTTSTPGGLAWNKLVEAKHQYLPRIIMADDYDAAWDEWMGIYSDCKPEDFVAEMQEELDRRMEVFEAYQ